MSGGRGQARVEDVVKAKTPPQQQQHQAPADGGTPTTLMTSWAELDPGEARGGRFAQTGSVDLLHIPGDEEEDEDENADEESSEIAGLRRRRAYIIAQLCNVGESIRETEAEVLAGNCLPGILKRDLTPKDTVDESKTGSFSHGVNWRAGTDDGPGPKPLTHRAAERARALMNLFDADGDGCLSFDEFRAYLVKLGRHKDKIGERMTTDREFWLNYITDQAGPPAADDIEGTISFDGKLTPSGFVGHRRMIEPDHPLEADLLAMELDLLPDCLQRWLKAKTAFDRIDSEGVSAAVERGERGDHPPQDRNGSVERGEAQLLLADSGEIMSNLRVEEEISLATLRSKVLFQLVEERRKRNRLAQTQALSRQTVFDSQRIYRSSWLSWFLSGRAKEEREISWLEKSLIRIKTGLFRGFRTFYGLVGHPKRVLENLAQQGHISSSILALHKGSEVRTTLRAAIGDPEDDGQGFSVSLNYLHKGNASPESPVDALPPGVGLSVVLDLEGKYETTELAFETASVAVDKVLRAHLLPELKRSVLFHSMRVAVAILPDKTQVSRVALFWRAQANIDFQCRQLKLGLRPTDLVRELTISFFCPLQLSQILDSPRTVLEDRLKVSIVAEGCFCGPLLSKLLEEILAGTTDSVQQAVADSSEHDLDRVARQTRTQAIAPDMQHPLVAPKRKVTFPLGGGVGTSGGGGAGIRKVSTVAKTSWATSTGRLRTDLEKRLQGTKMARWLDRMWAFAARLRGTKAFAMDLEAASPLEFLDSSWARAYLPASWRSQEVFTTPGYAAGWFSRWKESLHAQATSLGKRAKEHLEQNRVRQEAAEERTAAAAKTEEGQRLAGLEDELARLGVSKALLAETMGEKEEETARRLREAKDKQMEEHADLEAALRSCTKYLLGPRELRIQSGPHVLAVEIQGLDIFDVLSTARVQGQQPDGDSGEDEDGGSRDGGLSSSASGEDD